MRTMIAVCLLVGCACWAAPASEPERRPLADLTLDEALDIAERLQPELAEAKALVDAASGRVEQAGAFPNPEAIAGAEQLPLDGRGSNEREYVAGIAQSVPLGRRLSKARQAELLEREVRIRGLDVTLRNLRRRVHSAFATALYQERALETQSEIVRSLEKAVAMTEARVEAGDAVRDELARVEMELARSNVEWTRAEALRERAMVELKAAMGDPALVVESLAGKLDVAFEIPALESLAADLSLQPELLLADAAVRAGQARIDLAKAERIPDVKVEVLYHRLDATRQNTLDVGLSIPLPLNSRNRGRLKEARAEAAAAEARSRSTRVELSLRLHEAHGNLTAALSGSRAFKSEILPRAETILKAVEARYAAGDASLNELLPVRRDWAAVQLEYLESLRDVMHAWAELRALSGGVVE